MGCTCATKAGPVELMVQDKSFLVEPCDAPKTAFHKHYRLQAKLGKGSFASVYCAKKVGDKEGEKEKSVAVKVIDMRGQDREHSDHIKSQTMKEMCLMQRVNNCCNVVKLQETFFEDGLAFAVMEKCDLSLIRCLEWMPTVTEHTIAKIVKQMLEALQSIHQVGVVHRDIKPDNFLCMRDGSVLLCDFGLSEVLRSGQKGMRGVNGTAPFMSPEMLKGQLYSDKTDVWSLGVIAYVMLRASFPYKPKVRTGSAMKATILAGNPEPSFKDDDLAESLPKHTPEASLFLCWMLKRDPSNRPTAEQALRNSKWITLMSSEPIPNAVSFRPTIWMGKATGAYDRAQNKMHEQTDLDLFLHKAQEIHHRRSENFHELEKKCRKKSPSPSMTNSTNSDISSRSGFSSATSRKSRASSGFMKSGIEI